MLSDLKRALLMEPIMFIILQIFFATGAVLKVKECHSDIPYFSCGIFDAFRLKLSSASLRALI